jgi:Putative Ig domain
LHNHLKLMVVGLLATSILMVPGLGTVLVPAALAVNSVPVLDVPGRQIVRQASSLTFTVNASNPDSPGERIDLSASGLPTGASFPQSVGNPVYSTFSWAPSATQPWGNYTVGFVASDDGNLSISVTHTVIIQVVRATSAPGLTVPLAQSIAPDTILSFAVVAVDTDIPPLPLTLSASGMPPGSSFDSVSGVFVWRPSADQAPGVYVVIFTASNGQGGVDSKRVSITVIAATPAGTTSTFNLQDQVPSWLLPFSIGILLGAVAWIWTRSRRSRDTSTILKSPNEPSHTAKP